MSEFRLPNNTQRLAIMGRTGSGKTVLGFWALSHANFDRKPWVIIDYKHDKHLNSIPRLEEIDLKDRVPKQAGLYIVHPTPNQKEDIDAFLWKIWEKENTGVFIDEAFVIPDSEGFDAILTQGRSKHIPIIALTQRPKFITKFVFTEADFFAVFHLQWSKDRAHVMEFVPADLREELPKHHSYWHDVGHNSTFVLKPVPDPDSILDRFHSRLVQRRHVI